MANRFQLDQLSTPKHHAALQRALLARALDLVAPGGALVYSTCSLEPEENEQVIAAVLHERPQWRVAEKLERTPGRNPGDGFRAFRLSQDPI